MKAFEYANPATLDEALKALSGSDDSVSLAGGTDLLDRMKDYVTSPSRVVYIRDLKNLAGVDMTDQGLTLGATSRLVEIIEHKEIGRMYPALRQAALDVATPQIRNMATVGGNLLQRPRCWYFRNGFGLLGGDEVVQFSNHGQTLTYDMPDRNELVRKGDNRYHSIFMTDGPALFVSPSSLAMPLVALNAKATIKGSKGERTVPVADLYRVPTSNQESELTVEPGEVLTKVVVPSTKGKNATYGVRYKQAHDWPLVSCSVCCEMDGETVSQARVVLYGVAPIPWRSEAAEKAITGQKLSMDTASKAGEAAVEGARPLSKNGYKVPLTKTVVKRALMTVAGNRYWEEG